MSFKLLIINGPNLNLLGTRQPKVYGRTTLAEIDAACQTKADALGGSADCIQSNHEGALIDAIHGAVGVYDGLIINAGAFTHTSIALMDALKSVALPTVELHLSNIHQREEFRQTSYISKAAFAQISGFGAAGYPLAIDALVTHLKAPG